MPKLAWVFTESALHKQETIFYRREDKRASGISCEQERSKENAVKEKCGKKMDTLTTWH